MEQEDIKKLYQLIVKEKFYLIGSAVSIGLTYVITLLTGMYISFVILLASEYFLVTRIRIFIAKEKSLREKLVVEKKEKKEDDIW